MDINIEYFNQKKEKARAIYYTQKTIYSPYFKSDIVLNSDGFHHLQFSARRERNKREQILKFSLLPLALKVIRNSGTLQEIRRGFAPIGKTGKDGLKKTKNVEFWTFIAIIGDSNIKIRVVLKRVGDGNIIFWSVMPDSNLKRGQKLYTDGIEDE
ncbi:hypothetical protein KJ786_03145 [Patescibacteria group bacterium]|nr:hypothetical protein [Patescibacteria group bacterium]